MSDALRKARIVITSFASHSNYTTNKIEVKVSIAGVKKKKCYNKC
jgi:hypothetical protein